ncbi:hypothetical protein GCM10010885_06210 [Alicyclobacillus cellulosilyticus]|uniref:N-acetyltransferase domain-containing protein n=1 Tax=Alicyclobacillus cellulosilyticus TaxID=1003997 RepID=A0A917K5C1_9BACL|nr:GNAT family N-acetyltransferase [Alicyclobacillus cellulosilyticus]GGI99654.1 hypothetical protein GCM10010885_06210 [Alicyclobacillus cellulosilyticus]
MRRRLRIALLAASLAVFALCALAALGLRALGRPLPLWMGVGLTYGGVFTLFWWLDRFGRAASRLRAERDARRPVPRPRPRPAEGAPGGIQGGGASAAAHGAGRGASSTLPANAGGWDDAGLGSAGGTARRSSLRRVPPQEAQRLQALLDAAAAELQVLAEWPAARGAADAVPQTGRWRADEWLADPARHVFFIVGPDRAGRSGVPPGAGPDVAGCCALHIGPDRTAEITLVYVDPLWRRLGLASEAVEAMASFAQLLGGTSVWVRLPPGNARARRFFQQLQFRPRAATGGPPAGEGPAAAAAAAAANREAAEVWVRPLDTLPG